MRLDVDVLAPLWQQAFDWFNEKYDLMSHVSLESKNHLGENYYYEILNHTDLISDETKLKVDGFSSPLEAKKACLEKLIEMLS